MENDSTAPVFSLALDCSKCYSPLTSGFAEAEPFLVILQDTAVLLMTDWITLPNTLHCFNLARHQRLSCAFQETQSLGVYETLRVSLRSWWSAKLLPGFREREWIAHKWSRAASAYLLCFLPPAWFTHRWRRYRCLLVQPYIITESKKSATCCFFVIVCFRWHLAPACSKSRTWEAMTHQAYQSFMFLFSPHCFQKRMGINKFLGYMVFQILQFLILPLLQWLSEI